MILPFEQHEDDGLLDVVLISRAGWPGISQANPSSIEPTVKNRFHRDSIASAFEDFPNLTPVADPEPLLRRKDKCCWSGTWSAPSPRARPHRLAGYREDARLSVDHQRTTFESKVTDWPEDCLWLGPMPKGANLLDEHLSFAFNEQLGYLTACPTNVGTGIRLSSCSTFPGSVWLEAWIACNTPPTI